MANVLLVYPKPKDIRDRRFGFSLNLLYLSSILKQAGNRIVNYLDYSLEPFDVEKFHQNMERADVVILEFDSFPLKRSINIAHGQELARTIKKNYSTGTKKDIKVILFGNDISIFPGRRPHTDYTLAENMKHNIPIIIDSLLAGNQITELHPMEDLDQLPFPDRSLLSHDAQHGGSVDRKPKLKKSTLVETSRGCLNNCIFCQRKAWHKGFQTHSIPYVLKEFEELKKHYYSNIWITDDNFTYDLKRAKALLKGLAAQNLTENMKIALSSWTRIDEEFLELAKKSHVSIISFGVESANYEILKFYKKKIHLERFQGLIRFADAFGLYTVGNFIIGAPMETKETISETFDYIMETPFDHVNIKILDYMAGSALYENLPSEKKTLYRHLFACKEEELNDFPLEVLKEKINRFQKTFQEVRKDRLKKKVEQNGPPYHILR